MAASGADRGAAGLGSTVAFALDEAAATITADELLP